MNRFLTGIRRPVRREGADLYLLVTLLTFGLSVALTRLFLELTGYPQLGNETLHIAHVLWGGLLLFAAALAPLIWANRWVYTLDAVLAGVGVGLFIDEVGKFITQNNDYFHPAAAPIIYAFFLITVLVYLQVRRPPARSPRAELYRALEALEELLDHDLDPAERDELEGRLRFVAEQAESPDLARLAQKLLEVLTDRDLTLAPDVPTPLERFRAWVEAFETGVLGRGRWRALLIGGLAGLGLVAVGDMVELLLGARDPARLERMLADLVAGGRVASAAGALWFAARVALEGLVGAMLVAGAGLWLAGREARAAALSALALVLALTTVNLVVFYFDQFTTVLTAGVQFLLLLGVLYYRRAYLRRSDVRE